MNKNNDHDTWVYHKTKTPDRKIVKASEAQKLYKQGWTDHPNDFPKGILGLLQRIILFYRRIKDFCLKHPQAIIPAIIALLVCFIGTATALFIH